MSGFLRAVGGKVNVVGRLGLVDFFVPFFLSWWCWFNVFDLSNFETWVYVVSFFTLACLSAIMTLIAYLKNATIPTLPLALVDGGLMFFTVNFIAFIVNAATS